MNYKKIRPKRRKFRNNKILYLFILFLLIGIGYASLTTSLSINGTTNVATNSWNTHFSNLRLKSGSVPANQAASIQSGKMSISYEAELALPGDYYEFSVDVVNDGTLPAKVSLVNITGNNTSYLETSYSYVGGHEIKVGDILDIGKSKKIVVSAWIPNDIDTSLLPSEDSLISLVFNLQYVQSEIDGIQINPCSYDGPMTQGAEYVNGQYTYRYMQEGYSVGWTNITSDGWGVSLTDRNSTEPVTTEICTLINNKPIVSMSYMFYNSKTSSIDVSSFNTSQVINMDHMFYYSDNIQQLDLSNFDTSNVTNMYNMLGYCNNLETLNLSNFDFIKYNANYLFPGILAGGITNLKRINLSGSKYGTIMVEAFGRLGNVEELILDYVDTSNATDMSSMFIMSSNITKLDLSSFDTSKVTNMKSMLQGMSSLKELDMSNWDFTHYTNIPMGTGMFYRMNGDAINNSIETINLGNAILPIICDDLFYGVSNINNLNLKNVDTSQTTNMKYMFYFSDNNELENLDLSSFDTSNVTDMRYMFKNVPSVKEIDLSNFDVSNVLPGYLWGMFDGFYSLEKLDISSFDLSVYENSSSAIGWNDVSANEIVTPKNLNIGNKTITLKNRMYAQGDTVGITLITKDTPTQTVYKDHVWN